MRTNLSDKVILEYITPVKRSSINEKFWTSLACEQKERKKTNDHGVKGVRNRDEVKGAGKAGNEEKE